MPRPEGPGSSLVKAAQKCGAIVRKVIVLDMEPTLVAMARVRLAARAADRPDLARRIDA